MKKFLLVFLLLPFFINLYAQTIGNPEIIISIEDKFLQSPKISPDGKYLSFTEDNYTGIYLLNLSTGKTITLTEEPAAGFGLSWSADSKFILAKTAKFENNKRTDALKIFDIETNEAKIILGYESNLKSLPQWNLDGKSALIIQKNKLVRTSTNSLEKTSDITSLPEITLLQDGTKLALVNSAKQIKYLDPIKGSQYLNLAVSPDKTLAAFEVYGGDLYIMKVNGTGLINLGKGERPAWSSDGKYIAYTISNDDGYKYTSSEIYKVRFDGTEKTQLTNTSDIIEMNPNWSPDGEKIVFNDAKTGVIYSIDLSN